MHKTVLKFSEKDAKLVSFSKIGTSDSSLEVEIDQLMIELGKVDFFVWSPKLEVTTSVFRVNNRENARVLR